METTLESLQAQINALRKEIAEMPAFFGHRFTDALVSPNFATGQEGWKIDEHGNVEFNNGHFRGDITGASGTFSGSITASSGSIGGWLIGTNTLTGNNVVLDSTGEIRAEASSDDYIEIVSNDSDNAYLRAVVDGNNVAFLGWVNGGTYNALNNLIIASTVADSLASPNYPYWAFDPGDAGPNTYLQLIKYNSAVNIRSWYFDDGGNDNAALYLGTIGGADDAGFPQALTCDTDFVPFGDSNQDLGAEDQEWENAYIDKILGRSAQNVIDLGLSARIATNQLFVLKNSSADPTAFTGGIYFNTSLGKIRVRTAAGWQTVTSV